MYVTKFLPLFVALGFSILTILCYTEGPYVYSSPSEWKLYVFLCCVHVAVVLGYMRGWHGGTHQVHSRDRLRELADRTSRVYIFFAVVSVAGMYAYGMTPDAGLDDPSAARIDRASEASGSFVNWMATIGQVPLVAILAAAFAYWEHLGRLSKFSGLLAVAIAFAAGIGGGSRSGIWLALTSVASSLLINVARRKRVRVVIQWSVLLAVLFVAFTLYSSIIATQRSTMAIDSYREYIITREFAPIDRTHWLVQTRLPESVEGAILQGVEYFGHSYRGLALSLDEPFQGIGWGIGNSSWLMRVASRVTDSDAPFELSYYFRLVSEGRITSSQWVTAYPWVAADLTFPGCIIVMTLIGLLLARSWRSCLESYDFYGCVCFNVMMLVFFHIYVAFPTGDLGSLVLFHGSIIAFLLSQRQRAIVGVPRF